MNCCNCSSQFDHSVHVPRLLIFCGHSLCQVCCKQLHLNSRIQCPQCLSNTFIQQVIFLPKNLALLKVSSPTSSNNNTYCIKHEKKYEAFCKKEKVLICVDCILHDNHRNHEMDTIKNAYVTEEANLKDSIQSLQNSLTSTQGKYDDNLNNQKSFFEVHDFNCEQLVQYFNQLRELIDKQQDTLFGKLKEHYDSALLRFQQKNNKFLTRIQQLSFCLSNLKQGSKLSEVQFLSSVNQRQEVIFNIGTNAEQSLKIANLTHNKNTIAQLVTKSIEKNFKILNQNPLTQQGNKTPQANPKTKKLSNHQTNNQPYQSMKQYDSLQVPTNQNLKPMSKKVSKKEPIPAASALTAGFLNMISSKSSNPPLPITNKSTNVQSQKKCGVKQKGSEKQKFEMGKNCDISIVEQKQSLFNSFFSNMTSFLTEQKYIYVVGGFDEQFSNMIKLNLSTLKWEQVSSLKAPRSKFGCVAIDKSIFIVGGKKGRERVSDIQIWNNGNWNSSLTLKKKRSGFGIISFENYIYVIGGNDGENILNSVQILNTLTGQWSKSQCMAEARDELAVCLGKDQKIYAIGGFGGKNNEPLKSVEMFDIKTQKWYKVPPLNIQRRALAAASLADGIYAIGGFDGTKHLSSVQKYEQGSSVWIKIADLRRGRCTHSAVSIFDTQEIIVMGGFDQQALDCVQKYSLISNQWQQISKMPNPRFMHSCVLFVE